MNDLISLSFGILFGLLMSILIFFLLLLKMAYDGGKLLHKEKYNKYKLCYDFVKHVQDHLENYDIVECKICGKSIGKRI